jgi:hypothetical protein
MRTTIRVASRAEGWFDYTKEAPGFTMRTKMPPALEGLEGQLEANQVPRADREKLRDDLKQFGAAVISFPPLCGRVYCQP